MRPALHLPGDSDAVTRAPEADFDEWFRRTYPKTAWVVAHPIQFVVLGSLYLLSILGVVATALSTDALHRWRRVADAPMEAIVAAVLGIAVVITTTVLLWHIRPLRFSWWWIFRREGGNPLTEPARRATGPWRWLAGVYFVFVLLALADFAYTEEVAIRFGTRSWRDGAWRSLEFGVIHCVVGVPFAAAIGIALFGLILTAVYFHAGIDASAATHTIYNALLIVACALAIWLQPAPKGGTPR